MKTLMRLGLMSWCILGLLGGVASAETMYAKKSGVKVTVAKSPQPGGWVVLRGVGEVDSQGCEPGRRIGFGLEGRYRRWHVGGDELDLLLDVGP